MDCFITYSLEIALSDFWQCNGLEQAVVVLQYFEFIGVINIFADNGCFWDQ